MYPALVLSIVALLPQELQVPRDFYGDPLPRGALARFGTLRFRHSDWVQGLAFDSTGKVLTAVDRCTIRWWDAGTGTPARPSVEREGSGTSVTFSADGKRFACWERRKTGLCLVIYEAASGIPLLVLDKDFERLSIGLALSPDGLKVVSGENNGRVRVWNVATGALVSTAAGHGKKVNFAAFSPDGRFVATLGEDKALCLWNPDTGEALGRADLSFEHEWLAISKTGRIATARPYHKTIQVWKVAGLKESFKIEVEESSDHSPLFSPDGDQLVLASRESTTIHDAATGKLIRRIPAGGAGALTVDGRTLATALGPEIRIWNARTGTPVHDSRPRIELCARMWLSPDDEVFKTYGEGTQTWDAATGRLRSSDEVTSLTPFIGFSPDGRHFARWVGRGEITIHAASDDRVVGSLKFEAGIRVYGIALSNDLKKLVLGDHPSRWLLYDIESGAELSALDRTELIGSPRFSHTGELMAFGNASGNLHIRDSTREGRIRSLKIAPEFTVWNHGFSMDARSIFASGASIGLGAWSLESGERLLNVPSNGLDVQNLAVSYDGRFIACALEDRGRLKIWETATGREVMSLDPEGGGARAIEFSNRGDRLAILTEDWNAVLWDLTIPAEARADASLESLWSDLGSANAAEAYSALASLARRGAGAVSFLREKLIRRPAEDNFRKALADLENDELDVRERALRSLRDCDAAPELKKRIADPDTSKMKASLLRGLVDVLVDFSGRDLHRLQRGRAVGALRRNRSPEAVRLLEELAEVVTDRAVREEAGRAVTARKSSSSKK